MSADTIRRKFNIDRDKIVQDMIRRRIRYNFEEIKEYYNELEIKFKNRPKKIVGAL